MERAPVARDAPGGGWSEDLAFARELAETAASIALDHFGSTVSHLKSDGTPVGEADLAVDRVLTHLIRRRHPEDAILSEESEPSGRSTRRWILDPVDGTVLFLAGEDGWGTHISLEVDDEVVVGVVTRPVRSAMWWAARGSGSWRGRLQKAPDPEARRLHVSSIDRLVESRVTAWPTERRPDLVAILRESSRWQEPSHHCLLSVAEGDLEAVCAFAGGPWDLAPEVVLVEEAEDGSSTRRAAGGWTSGEVSIPTVRSTGRSGTSSRAGDVSRPTGASCPFIYYLYHLTSYFLLQFFPLYL